MQRKWWGAVAFLVVIVACIFYVKAEGRYYLELEHAALRRAQNHLIATTIRIKDVGDIKLFLNPADRVITQTYLHLKAWEPYETDLVVKSLREGDTFVDLGANIGHYTVIASRVVGDRGRVYAFEPDPTNFAILERNVRLNGLDNVVLEEKAVSHKNGRTRLFLSKTNKGDHRIFDSGDGRPFVYVEMVTLDDYFADSDRRIDFVKMDTQGAEGAIVKGMRGVLEANPDIIMTVEFAPFALEKFGYTGEGLLADLRSHGLVFYDIGTWNRNRLKQVSADWLMTKFAETGFTNLLVTRGRLPELSDQPAK